ncbi:PREDICTED: histone-lysine N-methyltransferase, H3 lysine-79 specific-like [Dinoponera quadriceps]|uniref:Histone-lysine N-methyltransferase, H3 lysine-79 specific-like n=1 Tax=Dinoponera quadriceps TaxID=609295 RepID=A0A6P3XDV0_DINQU|nr:PREDICTED: histone-lysine N-methyltransferase, H3 lysine-79 specific-like [Dinoponera quadriceps]
MEISESNAQDIGNQQPTDLISVYVKRENNEPETDLNEVEIVTAAQHFCAIEIKETKSYNITNDKIIDDDHCVRNETTESNTTNSTLGNIQSSTITNVLTDPIYLDTLDSDSINIEFQKHPSTTEVFIRNDEHIQASNYNISTVTIPNELLDGLNLNIKKEEGTLYTAEWLCDSDNDASVRLRVLKDTKQNIQFPIDVDTSIVTITKRRGQLTDARDILEEEKTKVSKKAKKHVRLKSAVQDYRERLRKKAECMREKRRKLYEQESEEQRLQRLAKEAAKRREMRMYYETPEQRRKRLDAEAARKREYRMYNETPEDRRKRLDREAERRRVKRLSLYASETPEQRRERLNKESAKRREARLNQYAKETEEERKERLRRDALRAREMRFTRSAIETEEERRQRLVKDALRKREVRTHGHSVNNNFTELRTVRNFQELNDVQIRDNPENQLDGHYLSWMLR